MLKRSGLFWIVFLILCLGIIVSIWFSLEGILDKGMKEQNETGMVERVIDLDTLELRGGERVRLLCVNAPERKQPWSTAAETTLSSLLVGKEVTLKRDFSDRDTYGRLLRQVYLNDGTWLQEFLVRSGYARIELYTPDTTYCEALESARATAAREGKGIWAAKIPICDRDIYDCDDFADQTQAEQLYAACGGPGNDVHSLDGNGDEVVCESLSYRELP